MSVSTDGTAPSRNSSASTLPSPALDAQVVNNLSAAMPSIPDRSYSSDDDDDFFDAEDSVGYESFLHGCKALIVC